MSLAAAAKHAAATARVRRMPQARGRERRPGGRRRLRSRATGPHARPVRHATPEDLDRAEGLLAELRGLPGLRERKRGNFQRGARAFLHFHDDAGDLYADVRLADEFERMKVSTPGEQDAFLARVRAALQPG